MRKLFSLILVLALLPAVLAINVDVEKTSEDEVMIIGLEEPATYNLEITNNKRDDSFSFYTFFGSGLTPSEKINIAEDETKEVTINVYPRWDLGLIGSPSYELFIQGSDRSEVEKKLTVKIVKLEDALEVGASTFNPESRTINIFLENKVNFNFSKLKVDFSSSFFDLEEEFALSPYEKKEFEIELDKEDYNKLMAGFYTLYADVKAQDVEAELEGKIEFEEKDLLNTQTESYGLLISTKVIEKINEGNVVSETVTKMKKNIISRLFTNFSPEPDYKQRQGAKVYYTWEASLLPGESQKIIVKTNWLIPFLLILLIFSTFYFAKKYSQQKVAVKKRVSFVKAKGGEFALKVTVVAEAKEFVENVRIIERLPPLVKMYEKFAGEFPDKISRDKKTLEWDYNFLDKGEKRVMTYVVYSKVGILGKFALPGTIVRFKQDGKEKQATSNKAYFLSEQKDKYFN